MLRYDKNNTVIRDGDKVHLEQDDGLYTCIAVYDDKDIYFINNNGEKMISEYTNLSLYDVEVFISNDEETIDSFRF